MLFHLLLIRRCLVHHVRRASTRPLTDSERNTARYATRTLFQGFSTRRAKTGRNHDHMDNPLSFHTRPYCRSKTTLLGTLFESRRHSRTIHFCRGHASHPGRIGDRNDTTAGRIGCLNDGRCTFPLTPRKRGPNEWRNTCFLKSFFANLFERQKHANLLSIPAKALERKTTTKAVSGRTPFADQSTTSFLTATTSVYAP
jgi:hypothetical protein